VNADEYAAMRRELVMMRKTLNEFAVLVSIQHLIAEWPAPVKLSQQAVWQIKEALNSCPIAAELSKQEGGNVGS
jgi:hypothetical protein